MKSLRASRDNCCRGTRSTFRPKKLGGCHLAKPRRFHRGFYHTGSAGVPASFQATIQTCSSLSRVRRVPAGASGTSCQRTRRAAYAGGEGLGRIVGAGAYLARWTRSGVPVEAVALRSEALPDLPGQSGTTCTTRATRTDEGTDTLFPLIRALSIGEESNGTFTVNCPHNFKIHRM